MSAVIFRPDARAASTISSTRSIFGQLDSPAALRWKISAGMLASRLMRMSSSTASVSRAPSLRMWEMYLPPYSAATLQSSINSSVDANESGA